MTLTTKERITESSAGFKNACLCNNNNTKTETETSFNNSRKLLQLASKIIIHIHNALHEIIMN